MFFFAKKFINFSTSNPKNQLKTSKTLVTRGQKCSKHGIHGHHLPQNGVLSDKKMSIFELINLKKFPISKMCNIKCKLCNLTKPKSEFHASKKHKFGHMLWCIACDDLKKLEKRLRADEESDKYVLSMMKNMKKADNMVGNLHEELNLAEIKHLIARFSNICVYSGVKLEWKSCADLYHKGVFVKIDENIGYECENLQICSLASLYMRGKTTHKDFIYDLMILSLEYVPDPLIIN